MDNNSISKVLLVIGVLFILGSIFISKGIKLPLGRLPGDIIIKKENFVFYYPITIGILISVILTILFSLIRKH
ncbi:DUF2905 domain-containing protein [bacterium]|nr:DUF2905 domain-containing protein [bacterium]